MEPKDLEKLLSLNLDISKLNLNPPTSAYQVSQNQKVINKVAEINEKRRNEELDYRSFVKENCQRLAIIRRVFKMCLKFLEISAYHKTRLRF